MEDSWDGGATYSVGDEVMAKEIKALPQINGVVGKVVCLLGERYGVLFPDPFGEKSLRGRNLQLVKMAGASPEPARGCESNGASQDEGIAKGAVVTIVNDEEELERVCRPHPSLPSWNKKKARHAGKEGKILAIDHDDGVYQIGFPSGEECWFPKEVVAPSPTSAGSPQKSPRSPAISALPPSYKCPIKVLCDPVDTENIPGGMVRENSVLSKDRKVVFDEENIEVATYDPSGVEDKEQMKKQMQEAKLIEEMLAKRRKGVTAVEEDEGKDRFAVEKEELKKRKGLKGSYQNDRMEIEIALRNAEQNRAPGKDVLGPIISEESDSREALCSEEETVRRNLRSQYKSDLTELEIDLQRRLLEVEIEISSNEDLYRYAINEEQTRMFADILEAFDAGKRLVPVREAEAVVSKQEEPPKKKHPLFLSPGDIFVKQGWCYDEENELNSPPKQAIPDEQTAAVKETPQTTSEDAVSQEDYEKLLEQISNLTKIASVLRENNEELKTKYEGLEKDFAAQSKDLSVMKRNREKAEKDLQSLKGEREAKNTSNDWETKYEKLKAQMNKGYESMKAIEEKNAFLTKLTKLFEAHDKTAYSRAVKLITGTAPATPSEPPEQAQLRKTIASLKQANETLEKKYQATLRSLTQVEAKHALLVGKEEAALKNKGSSTNTVRVEGDKQNGAASHGAGLDNLAAELEEEKRKHAECKRLVSLFQQKLKASGQPEDENKVEGLKNQLTQHQDKLARVKEERDKLQKELKKEREKTKELRAAQAKKK
eukprot:TRINITY_DN1676_c0_g2_i2.p1 TRINITY_DN1676_c0_g2~~TRINITY_DN1676_c0_g2_i2.p1  ORF type:complete len:770 (+),score=214.96 TRINITY_DN1676_c0_g2_i2:112-2421(+)